MTVSEEWYFEFCVSSKEDRKLKEKEAEDLLMDIIGLVEKRNLSMGGGVRPYKDDDQSGP